MTETIHHAIPAPMTNPLESLGWSAHFAHQWQPAPDDARHPARITEVHRDRLDAITPNGTIRLTLPTNISAGDCAVGDWVLVNPDLEVDCLLDRQTLLSRRAAGTDARVQLIAANVATLFVTSSCNADFNPARIERYLAMSHEAGCFPVLLLTKADTADDPQDYVKQGEKLDTLLPVLAIDAHDPNDLAKVAAWCKPGQTAALVGSSGVGKSTVTNGLTGDTLATAEVRTSDAKGRHTTTSRTLRAMINGGWLIDTPGMRAVPLSDASDGIEAVFGDISELTGHCKFSDCAHESEPGCAVQAAVMAGTIDQDRFARWKKLLAEEAHNTTSLADARKKDRAREKTYSAGKARSKAKRGG